MNIVVDTNIIVSTLIKSDGKVGTVLFNKLERATLYSCYYLYVEIFDKKDKIRNVSRLDDSVLLELLYLVMRRVTFINEDQISPEAWAKAEELTQNIDVKDISFVALSIQLGAKLWTGDKKLYTGLKEKGFNDVLTTGELEAWIQ